MPNIKGVNPLGISVFGQLKIGIPTLEFHQFTLTFLDIYFSWY